MWTVRPNQIWIRFALSLNRALDFGHQVSNKKGRKRKEHQVNMDSYLYSKQLVKLRQGHMLVLHLPPGVLDGVNAALQEVRGRRRKVREGATPRQSRSDQLVQEDALHGHRLQYWWGLNRVKGSKDVTVSGKHHIDTISDREASTLVTRLTNYWLLIFSLCILRAVERWKVTLEQLGYRRLAQEGAEACRSSPETTSVTKKKHQLIKSTVCRTFSTGQVGGST